MQIAARHEIGDLGLGESKPVLVEWRWYYGVPGAPLLLVVVLLLVLIRKNRRRQAWLILLPLGATVLVWQVISRPFDAQIASILVITLAVGWTAVWLVSPWLARLRWGASLASAAGVMLAIGGLSFICHHLVDYGEALPLVFVGYVAYSLDLLAAMALAAYCCRHNYTPGRFTAWLVPGTAVGSVIATAVSVIVIRTLPTAGSGPLEMVYFVVLCAIAFVFMGGLAGTLLYLGNLAFLLLAFRSPFYGERFRETLRLSPPVEAEVVESRGQEAPAETERNVV